MEKKNKRQPDVDSKFVENVSYINRDRHRIMIFTHD